jgi:hypothetical protein
MPLRVLMSYWQANALRLGLGLLVLIVAAGGQYYLANVRLPVNVAATNKFAPATVKLGEEELIIDQPVVSLSDGLLLAHNGNANEAVDINFDNAWLAEETVELLQSIGVDPPQTAGEVSYTTQNPAGAPASGEACRTFFKLELRDASKSLDRIHFYQLEASGLDRYRQIEIRPIGQDLVLSIATELPPGGTNGSPGCRKLLKVNEWSQYLNGSLGIEVFVRSGSSLRLRFQPVMGDRSLWGGPVGFFEALTLGSPKLKPSDTTPLQTHGIRIRRQDDNSATSPDVLSAKSVAGGELLIVNGLKIGSDQLQINASGKGKVVINGDEVTVDLLERAKRYPLPAGLLATANAALLAWFIRLLRPPSTKEAVDKPRARATVARSKRNRNKTRQPKAYSQG